MQVEPLRPPLASPFAENSPSITKLGRLEIEPEPNKSKKKNVNDTALLAPSATTPIDGTPTTTCCQNPVTAWFYSMMRHGWTTAWKPSTEIQSHYPPRHSDYRDSVPDDLATVYNLYNPVVRIGSWNQGLLDMWTRKNKAVKHSVHIPCWDSYKINPCLWRGVCFGRTLMECFWTGTRQMRWSRAVYAAGLSSEYIYPVYAVGSHGYKSDIKALCWLYCCMGCLFGCGIGQVFSLCGNLGCNFGACYSCHARERLRRKYKLPASFGMPPGIDDCLVHFFCFYCSSHQELRELAVRGIDGPGMHIFDVLSDSFAHVEGAQAAIDARKALVEVMLSQPPKIFTARGTGKRKKNKVNGMQDMHPAPGGALSRVDSTSSSDSSLQLGWTAYKAPVVQGMRRYGPSEKVVESALPRTCSF